MKQVAERKFVLYEMGSPGGIGYPITENELKTRICLTAKRVFGEDASSYPTVEDIDEGDIDMIMHGVRDRDV